MTLRALRALSPSPNPRPPGAGEFLIVFYGCTIVYGLNHTVHPMPDPHVKYLRQNQTPAESRLWFQLRRKRIANRAFRRQHRLDRYIVDFVCLSARLVIEVDGPSHDLTVAEDAHRTRRLEAQGFRVLRFPNAQILTDLDSVVRTIEAVLQDELSIEDSH
jgi:very-short-patch-repair endonuclease